MHEMVTPPAPANLWDTLALKANHRPRVSPRRNLDLPLPMQGFNLEAAPEHEIRETQNQLRVKIRSIAYEVLVRSDRDIHIEITRSAASAATVSLTFDSQAHAVVDTRRHAHFDCTLGLDSPHTSAVGTRLHDLLTAPGTLRAGARDLDEAVAIGDASSPVAGLAGGLPSRCRPIAGTGGAGLRPGNLELDLGSRRGLEEVDLELVAQIRTASPRGVLPTPRGPSPKHLGEKVFDATAEAH